MSDFLSRLAHRAVALGASRGAPGSAPHTPLEIDAEERDALDGRVAEPPVTVRTSAGPDPKAVPVDRPAGAEASGARAVTPARPEAVDRAKTHDDAHPAGPPRDPEPGHVAETGRAASPGAETTPPGVAPVETEATPLPERAAAPREGARELVRATAEVVTARPYLPLEPPLTRTPGPRVDKSSSEVAPVRIHIGRLEVRAALPAEPETRSPRRVATPDAPAVLSLSEYLRGEGRRQ